MATSVESPVVSTANFLLQCARRQPQLLRDEALQASLGIYLNRVRLTEVIQVKSVEERS